MKRIKEISCFFLSRNSLNFTMHSNHQDPFLKSFRSCDSSHVGRHSEIYIKNFFFSLKLLIPNSGLKSQFILNFIYFCCDLFIFFSLLHFYSSFSNFCRYKVRLLIWGFFCVCLFVSWSSCMTKNYPLRALSFWLCPKDFGSCVSIFSHLKGLTLAVLASWLECQTLSACCLCFGAQRK